MNNTKLLRLAATLAALFIAPPVLAAGTVTINNVTTCMVTEHPDNSVTYEDVPGVSIYSFYYTSDNASSRTLYSEIPSSTTGQAYVSDYSPGFVPYTQEVDMGYAPSPAYITGELLWLDYHMPDVAPGYIFQVTRIFNDTGGNPITWVPQLELSSTNPCITHHLPASLAKRYKAEAARYARKVKELS